MEILVKIGQFLLSLSILVVLHELGHFTFAKLFKARVEKFYMFFNPGFSLFKFKKGETEYGIGWIPLGGYVKISGMIDESMDKEQMALPPQPHEFRSKPAWQRLLIMIGGVLVNFILAFIIYIAVMFTWGKQYLPTENVKYGIVCDSLAQSIGLQNGDKIVSVDNQKIEKFRSVIPTILLDKSQSIQVIRNQEEVDIQIPSTFVAALLERSSKGFKMAPIISERLPLSAISVGKIMKDYPAAKSGLQKGDKILAVNGEKVPFFDQYKDQLMKNAGKEVELEIMRDDKVQTLKCGVTYEGAMGFGLMISGDVFEYKTIKYTFLESIPAGLNEGVEQLQSYLKQFKLIFSKETKGYKSLGGFLTIGNIFPGVWDWHAFWNLTAFLSIILAIMNILPIPALDGGHVLFLLYEMITGRKPGDKFLEYAQITGMVLLFSLLIFANVNDIMKLFN